MVILNKKFNSDLKIKNNFLIKKIQNDNDFMENFNELKNRIKIKDRENIDFWGKNNKKNNYFKKKIEKKINLIKIVENVLIYLINNLSYFNKIIFENKKINNIFYKFLKINNKKIKIAENNNYYKINNCVYIIIDLRSLKTKIILLNKKKCLYTLTNGLVFKKMNLDNKKYKKSEKITYLTLKTFLLNLNLAKKFNKIFIQTKGLKKYYNNIVKYVNNKIEKNNTNKIPVDLVFVNTPKKPNNIYFKNKKIKSIKKRLKKKFIKIV